MPVIWKSFKLQPCNPPPRFRGELHFPTPDRSNDVEHQSRTSGIWLPYNSSPWPIMLQITSGFRPTLRKLNVYQPYKFSDYHWDYPGQGFTKLKHNEPFSPTVGRVNSHLNSCTNFVSTWLHPETFRPRSQCLGSPVPKYIELLTSHHGSLRSKGHDVAKNYQYTSSIKRGEECVR